MRRVIWVIIYGKAKKEQTNQCPKKEIKRQTMIYKTTTQQTRN
jgi:hypothetical protein